MPLYEIDKERIYCGPAAIMAVTGKAFEEVRAAINAVRGRKHNCGVRWMYPSEVHEVLLKLIPSTEATIWRNQVLDKPTLSHFSKFPKCKMIVLVTGHFVAVEKEVVFDNHIRFGCHVSEHPSRRKRVKEAIYIKSKHAST